MPLEPTALFNEIRNWLEVIYFASGIILMILAGLGLRQLHLAKEQIETTKKIFKTQSKRAAIEAAIIECKNFSESIVQTSIALDKYCEDNSITYFEDTLFIKTEDGFSIDPTKINPDDVSKLSNASDIINKFVNGLEGFALFFLSGVADEKIAFHVNAKTYLMLAEQAFKLFPIGDIEEDDLEPVKTLYFMWHKKYEAKKLKIEHTKISKKLQNYKEHTINPIGA